MSRFPSRATVLEWRNWQTQQTQNLPELVSLGVRFPPPAPNAIFNVASSPEKIRLDRLVAEQGLAPSREKAQALILAGQILVNGQKLDKAGVLVPSDAVLRLLGEAQRYVSRGGVKLEAALRTFAVDPTGWTCLDIGSSTGGFTDCLLQHGAARVYAFDSGSNQMDWKLRNDPRVRLREQFNARYLRQEDVGESVDLLTMDVSFISATLLLPASVPLLRAGGRAIILVKPQFEAGREQVGKGGLVRDPQVRAACVAKVREAAAALGLVNLQSIPSPILGGEGNQEFLLYGLLGGEVS